MIDVLLWIVEKLERLIVGIGALVIFGFLLWGFRAEFMNLLDGKSPEGWMWPGIIVIGGLFIFLVLKICYTVGEMILEG
jgi:hypothetical protein